MEQVQNYQQVEEEKMLEGHENLMLDLSSNESSSKRSYKFLNKQEQGYLIKMFQQYKYPKKEQLKLIADKLSIEENKIQSWFKRQRKKEAKIGKMKIQSRQKFTTDQVKVLEKLFSNYEKKNEQELFVKPSMSEFKKMSDSIKTLSAKQIRAWFNSKRRYEKQKLTQPHVATPTSLIVKDQENEISTPCRVSKKTPQSIKSVISIQSFDQEEFKIAQEQSQKSDIQPQIQQNQNLLNLPQPVVSQNTIQTQPGIMQLWKMKLQQDLEFQQQQQLNQEKYQNLLISQQNEINNIQMNMMMQNPQFMMLQQQLQQQNQQQLRQQINGSPLNLDTTIIQQMLVQQHLEQEKQKQKLQQFENLQKQQMLDQIQTMINNQQCQKYLETQKMMENLQNQLILKQKIQENIIYQQLPVNQQLNQQKMLLLKQLQNNSNSLNNNNTFFQQQ